MPLTLEEYAHAKQLDIAFLHGLGISELTRQDREPYIRIPYHDVDGVLQSARYRDALSGRNRFRWKSGDKPLLYGCDRLADARNDGFILIVEGESDCHTLWQADMPALGMPGAGTWKEERDAPLLEGIDRIYIVDEGDGGASTIMKRFAGSAILARARVVSFGEHKDPSGLYLSDPANFKSNLHGALALAQPYRVVEQTSNAVDSEAAFEQCRALAERPDILAALCESLARIGVVGEDRNAKLIYLALTSRFLDKPVSMATKGPSATGKSYVADRVIDHFPASAFHKLTAMSERALLYNTQDFRHRFLVFAEAGGAQGDMQDLLLRSLLSEGRIDYDTVGEVDRGKMGGVRLTKEGPTGLLFTTTKLSVHAENETRLISLSSNDTSEQTRAIMESIATRPAKVTIGPEWDALQTWLAGAVHSVTTPFLLAVAKLTPARATRMRRDFMSVKSLIETHALLHQATREKDADGNIVATLADYDAVRGLVNDLLAEGQALTVKPAVRETVDAVRLLTADGMATSNRAIAQHIRVDDAATSRRCAEAVKQGYLINQETVPRQKPRYVLGEPMPRGSSVLPSVARIEAFLSGEGGCVEDPPPLFDDNSTNSPGDDVCSVVAISGRGVPTHPPCEDQEHDAADERAAILEFDAGYPRTAAERLARSNGSWRELQSDDSRGDHGGWEGC